MATKGSKFQIFNNFLILTTTQKNCLIVCNRDGIRHDLNQIDSNFFVNMIRTKSLKNLKTNIKIKLEVP